MKVLFVSDSLGAPIEQRGIHNFSMSLIENLKAQNAVVDLLVQRPPGRWFASTMRSKVVDLDMTRKSVALAELLRYFTKRLTWNWIGRCAESRYIPKFYLKLAGWALVAFVRVRGGATVKVENDPKLVDFVPATAHHLALPDNFVATPFVYSEMMMRAAWRLPPDKIDASGYNLVIVDTPSYFRIENIDPKYIVAVVHDIIPLRDPSMAPYWRNLFINKLEAIMRMHPNFVFVSQYSRDIFSSLFPNYEIRRGFVYYPTLSKSAERRACEATSVPQLRYAPTELANLERSVELQDRADADRDYESEMERQVATTARYRRAAQVQEAYLRLNWNSTLPYFVTVVSDEPRKNIDLLIKAFRSLKGRANMVVLGNVDRRRYIGYDVNATGQIRFTGYIAESEKARILATAEGLIFPSFTEGFGIPITEGALYSKPVLCSEIDVFREVAGEDAFYFDPYREDSLVAAVDAVIADPVESAARALRLKTRVLERFTSEAAAARLKNLLQQLGLSAKADYAGAAEALRSAEPVRSQLSSIAPRVKGAL